MLDHFDDIAAWKAVASDGVTASLQRVVDAKRPAMRLDFDLGGTAGYAIARRSLPIDLPDNYAITFWLRADAPVNDLQVKFADASGDNVWWYRRPDFAFSGEWRPITIRKRQIEFAWGPAKDRALRHVSTLEIAVAAGSGGGRGSVYVSDIALQELPSASAPWAAADRARVVVATGLRARARARRQQRDGMAQQGRPQARTMADRGFRAAARIRRPRPAVGEKRARVALRRAVLRRRRANGGRCAASPTAAPDARRCC